jgi:hypothetical protein
MQEQERQVLCKKAPIAVETRTKKKANSRAD